MGSISDDLDILASRQPFESDQLSDIDLREDSEQRDEIDVPSSSNVEVGAAEFAILASLIVANGSRSVDEVQKSLERILWATNGALKCHARGVFLARHGVDLVHPFLRHSRHGSVQLVSLASSLLASGLATSLELIGREQVEPHTIDKSLAIDLIDSCADALTAEPVGIVAKEHVILVLEALLRETLLWHPRRKLLASRSLQQTVPSMGNSDSKPKPTSNKKLSKVDEAVWELKTQRDKMRTYQKQLERVFQKETQVAKDALAKGDRRRALLALRKKKYQEALLQRTENQMFMLEQM
ncbi:Charged multivesicular body protein 6, partial [Gonapodya sp. JEL0774]